MPSRNAVSIESVSVVKHSELMNADVMTTFETTEINALYSLPDAQP